MTATLVRDARTDSITTARWCLDRARYWRNRDQAESAHWLYWAGRHRRLAQRDSDGWMRFDPEGIES